MSHFTHICSCGHARENHHLVGNNPCGTSGIIKCGCRGADYGPTILRESFVPAWVDSHRMGEHKVTPIVEPGTRLNLGSGTYPSCTCDSCRAAYAGALAAS